MKWPILFLGALVMMLMGAFLVDVLELRDAPSREPSARSSQIVFAPSSSSSSSSVPSADCIRWSVRCKYTASAPSFDLHMAPTDRAKVAASPLSTNAALFESARRTVRFNQAANDRLGFKALPVVDKCRDAWPYASESGAGEASNVVASLEALNLRLRRKSPIGDAAFEVAFSVLDQTYAPVLEEHFERAQRFVPFPMFYLALDAVAAREACRLGAPFIAYPLARVAELAAELAAEGVVVDVPEKRLLAVHIALAKYEPVALLMRSSTAVFFYEMDVFVVRPLLPMLAQYAGAWMAVSGHVDFSSSVNIGIYRVVPAHGNVTELFDYLVRKSLEWPEVHDQLLFRCCMMPSVPRADLPPNHFECSGNRTIERLFLELPSKYGDWGHGLYNSDDEALPWWRRYNEYGGFATSPHVAVYDANIVMSSAFLNPHNDVAMLHYLAGAPLLPPDAKFTMAKEHGVFGTSAYFGVPGQRFLALEGSYFLGSAAVWQAERLTVPGTLLALAALALATNRTLILPSLLGRWRVMFAYEFVDPRLLDSIGVDWRASSFLDNPRLAPAVVERVVRLYAMPDAVGVQSGADGRQGIAWREPHAIEHSRIGQLLGMPVASARALGSFTAAFGAALSAPAAGASLLLVRNGDLTHSPFAGVASHLFQAAENLNRNGAYRTQRHFVSNGSCTDCAPLELALDIMLAAVRRSATCGHDQDYMNSASVSIQPSIVCGNAAFAANASQLTEEEEKVVAVPAVTQ